MIDDVALITGGTGFIGAHVAAEFVARGDEVVVYDRSTDDRILDALGVAESVAIRRGDVADGTDIADAVAETGATRIVHLAAVLSDRTETDPVAAERVNVRGTTNVFEAARERPSQVKRIAWSSSATVYAPPARYAGGDDRWVDEDDAVDPATLYGGTKAYCERQARVYRDAHGVSDVALRPTLVYGPYQENGSSGAFGELLRAPARGESVTTRYGDQTLAWLHVEDVARAFYLAATADEDSLRRRAYNVRGPLATVREAAETIESLLPDARITVTDDGVLPWTQRLDTTRIESDLGFEPRYDLESGFQRCLDATDGV